MGRSETPLAIRLCHLGALLLAFGMMPLANAQSYQSSFSGVKFDRAKGPATFNAGAKVDVATGAVSMEVPLGPGIGSRGLSFRPTLSLKTAPQMGISSSIEHFLLMAGTVFEHTGSQEIDQLYFKGSGGASLTPGSFDLALMGAGAPMQSSYSLPGGGGGTVLGVVPGAMDGNVASAQALLARFGVTAGIASAPSSIGSTKSPLIRMGSGGHLVVGLQSPYGDVTDWVQYYEWNSGGNKWNFPRQLMVISGEIAYEYTYVSHRYATKFRPYLAYSETNPLMSAHYVVTRVLNRFGESIQFSYGANGLDLTATHSTTGNVVKLERTGTQGIAATPCLADGSSLSQATTFRVSYQITGATAPSYTLVLASAYGIGLENGNGPNSALALSVQGNRQLVDALDDRSNWGSALQNVQPISVTRDAASGATAEQISFEYGFGSAQSWNGGVPVTPVVLQAVKYPNRALAFDWTPIWYRPSYSPNAWGASGGPVGRPAIAYGVTQLTDRDMVAGVSRVTSYTRVTPQLNWSASAASEYWVNSAFYVAVQAPDGQTSLHRFVSPSTNVNATTSDEGLRNLAYLKHVEYDVRYFEAGVSWQSDVSGGGASGNVYRWVVKDRFDLRTMGNPSGDFDKYSVPYPTRTRSWDRDSKVLVTEESTSWDSSQYGWTQSHRVSSISGAPSLALELRSLQSTGGGYSSPGAYLGIEETTTKTFNNKVTEWFFNRITNESTTRDADNTGFFASGTTLTTAKPPIAKTFDDTFNTLKTITLGNTGGAWITTTLTPKGSSGLAASQLQSALVSGAEGSAFANSGSVGVSAYGYDAYGNMNSISVMPNASTTLTTRQDQDALGRPTAQYDADGRKQAIEWDPVGRLKSITPPGEVATTLTYHDDHRGITMVRGAQTQRLRYNGFGELVVEARKDPAGAWSHKIHGFDTAGRSSGETTWLSGDGSDHETTWKEADFAAVVTVTVPGPDRCVRWGWDDDGNRVCVETQSTSTTTTQRSPLPHTTLSYDGRSRVSSSTDLNGITTQPSYGGWSNGPQKTVTVAPGTDKVQTTTFQSDAAGRLVRVWDALGQRTDYRYDGADRIGEVDQFDSAGRVQTRTWRYTALGWLSSLGQPESGTTSYGSFTVQGKPTVTNYNGRVVRSSFDWMGRATDVWSDDGTVSQHFDFDSAAYGRGKLAGSRDGSVYAGFGYDSSTGKPSSLTTTASGQTFTQYFGYDGYGNRVSGYTGRAWWSQSFHAESGMPSLLQYNGSTVANTPWASYDALSWMPKTIYYGNGAASQFRYDSDQTRLAGITHLDGGSTAQANWSYQYDQVGNLFRENDLNTGLFDQYAFDKLNRLISAVVQSPTYGEQLQQFAYDAFGNRTNATTDRVVSWSGTRGASAANTTTTSVPTTSWVGLNPAENALWQRNQLPTQMTNGAYTGAQYDAQGNLTQVYARPSDTSNVLTMTYDALGRVTRVTHNGKGIREDYQYRADGLRTVIDDYRWGSYQKSRIQVYNDARQLVSQWEKSPSGSLTWKRDILYLGTREAAEIDAAGMHVTQVDHLGSPRVITGPNGQVESRQKYLPFGEVLEQSGAIKTAKGYTGHEQTDESGLIYMQARFYLPWFGRFASPDPARDQHFELTQSWNIASYVRNNPIMSTDPTGMVTGNAIVAGSDANGANSAVGVQTEQEKLNEVYKIVKEGPLDSKNKQHLLKARIEILKEKSPTFKALTAKLGKYAAPVVLASAGELSKNKLGGYGNNEIKLNPGLMNGSIPNESLEETLGHETQHNVDYHDALIRGSVELLVPATGKKGKFNRNEYLSLKDDASSTAKVLEHMPENDPKRPTMWNLYENNPVEANAFAAGRKIAAEAGVISLK